MMRRTSLPWVVCLAASCWSGTSVAQAPAPEPPPPPEPWYEAIELRAFVDAYASVNWDFPKPQTEANAVTRAYDTTNGFALSWVGFDASYAPDPVGGTIGLRLGPTARTYAGEDADHGLENVKQAFVSWKPGGAESPVTLDFGKFDQPYGAEVAESQDNMNYTRGVLYWLAQPLFFTGLRGSVELMPELTLRAVVVNGWNRSVDNNIGKTYGLQAVVVPSEDLMIAAGWVGGPEQDDFAVVECVSGQAYSPATGGCAPSPGAPGGRENVDRGGANDFEAWRHLLDLVVVVNPLETLSIVLNGNYGWEGVRLDDNDQPTDDPATKRWYGAMLGARLQLDEVWALAGRGEYYSNADSHMPRHQLPDETIVRDVEIATATLTVEAKPTENLILRLETRGDFFLGGDPTRDLFQEKLRDSRSRMLTTTLGLVVTTN
jgi:hypothetical protein